MPTFTSITLDRFLEPSPKRTMPTIEKKNQNQNQDSFSSSSTSPSSFSFPPSPQMINPKRNFNHGEPVKDVFVGGPVMSPNADVVKTYEKVNGNGRLLNVSLYNGNGDLVPAGTDNDITSDDFFDPRDTLSVVSSDTEECTGSTCNFKMTTPMAEFYDASEELSEGGSQSSFRDVEAELRERRLSWLMEIEGRKQAEETLEIMKKNWERLAHKLSLEGLTLPSASAVAAEDEKLESDPAEELCQQIRFARAVATSVGREAGKAEAEMEMESKIAGKEFEISRLLQRLHYYEAVNAEMSLINQEATDTARRLKQRRKRRQKWFWTAVGASVVCGSAALAWSFLPTVSGSPPDDSSCGPDGAPNEMK